MLQKPRVRGRPGERPQASSFAPRLRRASAWLVGVTLAGAAPQLGLPHALVSPAHAAEPLPKDPTARAEVLSAQAQEAFEAKRFADAIRLYLDAWEASPAAAILYNVAFIYDKRLDDPELAIKYYERAAGSSDADAALVSKARARVATLKAQLAGPTKDPVKDPAKDPVKDPTKDPVKDPIKKPDRPPPELPPIEDPSDGAGILPWIVVGSGGAVLLGGVAMGLVANSTHGDFEAATSAADKRDLQSSGETQALVADLLMGVGFVGVGVGLVWALVDAGRDEPAAEVGPLGRLRIEPMALPGGAGLVIGGAL